MAQHSRCVQCRALFPPSSGSLCPDCKPAQNKPILTGHRCQKCSTPIDYNFDEYTIFCDQCLDSSLRETAERKARVSAGDMSLRGLTPDEEQKRRTARLSQLVDLPMDNGRRS